MKQILDKIDEATWEIKGAANHGFGVFMIFMCSIVGIGYLEDIKTELQTNNTLLKTMVMETMKRDSVNNPHHNNALIPKKR